MKIAIVSSMYNEEISNNLICGAIQRYKELTKEDFNQSYLPNGAIYVFSTEKLRETRQYYMEKTYPYIMPKDRSADIDELLDFEWVEFLLQKENINR